MKRRKVWKRGAIWTSFAARSLLFFDEVLGEGASSKLFGENRSVDMCADAVVKLKECATNYDGVVNKFNAISGNRAQRRAKK